MNDSDPADSRHSRGGGLPHVLTAPPAPPSPRLHGSQVRVATLSLAHGDPLLPPQLSETEPATVCSVVSNSRASSGIAPLFASMKCCTLPGPCTATAAGKPATRTQPPPHPKTLLCRWQRLTWLHVRVPHGYSPRSSYQCRLHRPCGRWAHGSRRCRTMRLRRVPPSGTDCASLESATERPRRVPAPPTSAMLG